MTNADTARETIRARLIEADRHMRDADAASANNQTDKLNPLIDQWAEKGALPELLTPLLDTAEPAAVRSGAASILLNRGHPDLAIPTLEDIRDNDDSPAGTLAESVLFLHRSKQP